LGGFPVRRGPGPCHRGGGTVLLIGPFTPTPPLPAQDPARTIGNSDGPAAHSAKDLRPATRAGGLPNPGPSSDGGGRLFLVGATTKLFRDRTDHNPLRGWAAFSDQGGTTNRVSGGFWGGNIDQGARHPTFGTGFAPIALGGHPYFFVGARASGAGIAFVGFRRRNTEPGRPKADFQGAGGSPIVLSGRLLIER